MGDRYRVYPRARPRSPTFYNPARASLPINISGYGTPVHSEHHGHDHHMHAVPTRREIIANPRSSTSSVSTGPVITTTYKVSADPTPRVRDASRSRRSTLDSNARPVIPTIITAAPRHKPVVHSAGGRPPSPIKDPYRSSQEEYYAIPATSRHKHHHQKRYSATLDNVDMNRLSRERDSTNRLRVGGSREAAYSGQRPPQRYSGTVVPSRHPDTVANDYGDNGYGYTNPRDLVQYDLDSTAPSRHHKRRDSVGQDGGRARPNSISSYNELAQTRSFDGRERGPPPSTRGFDRLPARSGPPPSEWDQPQSRIEPIQRPSSVNRPRPVEPVFDDAPRRESIQRPASVNRQRGGDDTEAYRRDPVQRPASVNRSRGETVYAVEAPRRSNSRRPVSLYHDREPRRAPREDYYEARDEDPRRRSENSQRQERHEAEQRHGSRSERSDRQERPEKRDEDKKDHKTRDVLTTGLSLAGAALGVKAFADAAGGEKEEKKENRKEDRKEEREEKEEPRRRREQEEEPRRREYDEEPRRRRDPRDDREPEPLSREPKLEHRPSREQERESDFLDLSGRDPRERQSSREERDPEPERPLRRQRPDITVATSDVAVGSQDGSAASDEATPRRRRGESGAPAFNPKDTMDLVALKAALNSRDAATSKETLSARTPRESMSRGSQELSKVRSDLNADSGALRIVTPPLPADSKAPVKGILRTPREKFPEDPAPIREGVAPLKDAKKDGVPPDARWTKISRKLVNPEALEAGKERYEAREDFVIVLRVLSRDEVQGYAEVTERIRAAREEIDEQEERDARRRARRERHERHKRERSTGHRESSRRKEKTRDSESDTTDDDDRPKMLEGAPPMMSGGLGITANPAGSVYSGSGR